MDERSSATILGVEVANPLARADSGFAAPPPTPAATADAGRPDAAVRARLNAIVIDGLILAPILGLLLAGSGGPTRSPKALLLAAVLQFAYFFLLEARSGQTIGKRLCHIRVVGLDGAPITMGQAAVRNGLRFVDALPMLYASGLLSMMRTGAGKRQRIGDVVAGTAIVVVPGGRPLPTPRWLLPVATLLTTAGSICLLVLVLNAPAIPPPAGFTGAVSQRPMPGSWTATATVTSSAGYGNQPVGRSFVRAWVITRACNPRGACGLALTRQLAGAPPLTAALVLRADGWHATFPTRPYICGHESDGRPTYWRQHSEFVVAFADNGRTARANERDFSYAPSCGYGTDATSWSATRAAGGPA